MIAWALRQERRPLSTTGKEPLSLFRAGRLEPHDGARAVALVLISALPLSCAPRSSQPEGRLDDLFELVATDSPTGAMLAGGVAVPGGAAPPWRAVVTPERVAAVAAAIEREAERSARDSEAFRRLGALRIVQRRWEEARVALEERRALERGPAGENDLAALDLLRSQAGGALRDALQALDRLGPLDRVSEGPTAEIGFNLVHALSLGSLHLAAARERERRGHGDLAVRPHQAVPSSAPERTWSDLEAALSSGSVTPETIAKTTSLARDDPWRVEGLLLAHLLPVWTRARGSAAEDLLGGARRLAEAIAERTGDALALDLVRELAAHHPTERAQRSLALYLAGAEHRAAGRNRDALQALGAALDLSPPPSLARLIRLERAIVDYFRAAPRAIEALVEEERRIGDRRYPHLRARLQRMVGLASAVAGDWTRGARAFGRAAELYESCDDRRGALEVRTFEAQALARVGDFDGAWERFSAALPSLADPRAPRALHNALVSVYDLCVDLGMVHAARWIAEELALNAERTGDDSLLSEALATLARARGEIGRQREARDAIDRALAAADRIRLAPENRVIYELDLARVQARSAPEQALETVERLLRASEENGWTVQVERGLFLRATAEARLGRLDDAQRTLEQAASGPGVEASPERAATSPGPVEAARREALEQMIVAALDSDTPEALRRIAARARDGAPALPGEAIGDALSLEYLVLPDRLLVWTGHSGKWQLFVRPTPATELHSLVAGTRELLAASSSSPALRATLEQLWELLVAPIEEQLEPDALVAISPDGPLRFLPFAALRSPSSGRHLVELATPVVVQAGTAQARAPSAGSPPGVLLVVPPPDATSLVQVSVESLDMAGLYGDRLATARSVRAARAASDGAGIVHFAAHAEVTPARPAASRVELGPAPEDWITPAELRSWPLGSADLVYLSSCGGASVPPVSWARANPLVDAALSAGAREVIAAAWPIADADAAEMAAAFHREYATHGDAAVALASLQRSIPAPGSNPQWWSLVSYRPLSLEPATRAVGPSH
jgi:CHAT domain-containing protein/tetratricopeptide (TPR) repeat protein